MYLYIAYMSTNVEEGESWNTTHCITYIHHSSMYNKTVCSAHLLLNHITISFQQLMYLNWHVTGRRGDP